MACSHGEDAKQGLMKAYFEASFSQDYKSLENLLHPDLLFVGPKISDSLNRDELIDSWRSFHKAFDLAHRNNEESFQVGEEVFYYYEAEFHHGAKDRWLRFPLHVRVRFRDEKISFIQIYVNQADILKQLNGNS